jgi:nicotinic acid mononucleotide adenylyltransferase
MIDHIRKKPYSACPARFSEAFLDWGATLVLDRTHGGLGNKHPICDVAIVGGAFDPPHVGHLLMGLGALSLGFASKIWFVPSPDRPDKVMTRNFGERLELVEILCCLLDDANRNDFVVSSCEKDLGVFRGSLFLMRTLFKENPGLVFGFVMGQDTFCKMSSWNDPLTGELTGSDFQKLIPSLVYGRPGGGSHQGDPEVQVSRPVTHWPKTFYSCPDLDSVAATHGLTARINLGSSGTSSKLGGYSKLSSTLIRQALLQDPIDETFLKWAVGNRLLERLRRK